MREIYVDLSDDKCSPVVFGGYIGEHNELTDDITKYQFVFKNSKNEIQSDNIVEFSDINIGCISTLLTEEQTVGDCLICNVTAIAEMNGNVIRRAKTSIVSLKVRE